MKVIIAGSRDITDVRHVEAAVAESGFLRDMTEVVSGGALGVDTLGEAWARSCSIPVKVFPADWNKHGKRAGPLRNAQMAEYADALVAVWDGESRGTANMIAAARRRGLRVYVKKVTP